MNSRLRGDVTCTNTLGQPLEAITLAVDNLAADNLAARDLARR